MSEIEKKSLIRLRDGDLGDINFIYATWLKGLRFGNEWFKLTEQEAYFEFYHNVIERILSSPETAVKVACLVEDPAVIIGYSVFAGTKLHWVFCKKAWRNIGICRDLVPKDVSVVTHMTDVGASLLKKSPGVRFNPFLV